MASSGYWDDADNDGEEGVCSQRLAERTIKDAIHDYIPLSAYICAFIDTRQFQRLRAIKQLGVSYYVWPGAAHNRFEHCLGVAHLARLMVEWLKSQQPELGITDRDVLCVQLAGLCHDLGHGPWSHVWDGHFLPKVLPERGWTHEDASEMMFDDLVEKNDIHISQDDINFVKDLIKGVPFHSKGRIPPEKPFLFEIVANKRNGIDVDKFDYISRDLHAIGDKGNLSAMRLIRSARVINGEICYDIKDANQMYELCYTRFSNHKRIYSHKTARAIEFMIVDALIAAEPTMKIAGQIDDPERYVYLTDDIMPRIESTTCPELAQSRAIFDRFRTRDLYQCVDFKTFDWGLADLLRKKVTAESVVEAAKSRVIGNSGESPSRSPVVRRSLTGDSKCDLDPSIVEGLTTDNVIVDLVPLHYGMKAKNPLDFIKFYSKRNMNKAAKAGPGDFSTLMPSCFGEVLLRVYTKDKQYFGLVQAGYRAVIESLHLDHTAANADADVQDQDQNPLSPPITEAPATPRSRTTALPADAVVTPNGQIGDHAIAQSPPNTLQRTGKRGPSEPPGTARATPFTQNNFTKVPYSYVPQSPTREHKRRQSGVSATSQASGPQEGGPSRSGSGEGTHTHVARSFSVGTMLLGRDNKRGEAFESFMSEDTVLNEMERNADMTEANDADAASSETAASAIVTVAVSSAASASTVGLSTPRTIPEHGEADGAGSSSKSSSALPHLGSTLADAATITPRRSSRRKRDPEDDDYVGQMRNGAGSGSGEQSRPRSVSGAKRKKT